MPITISATAINARIAKRRFRVLLQRQAGDGTRDRGQNQEHDDELLRHVSIRRCLTMRSTAPARQIHWRRKYQRLR